MCETKDRGIGGVSSSLVTVSGWPGREQFVMEYHIGIEIPLNLLGKLVWSHEKFREDGKVMTHDVKVSLQIIFPLMRA